MKFITASAITLALATYASAVHIPAATPAARDVRYEMEVRDTTIDGIGPGVSLGATVVIGSETLNNPATYSGASSASGSTSSSATSSAGTAAASIRSSILASLSSHTMSNSANAASIRSGIESSLSAATASPSVSSISDGADPAPASLTTTKYALIASLGAALAGAFLL